PDAAEVARMAGEMAAAVGQHRRASDAWALAAAQYHALGRKESAAEMRRKREAALAVADDDEVIFEGTLE
ncbi:MAG: hypothetical protein KC620_24665, partial [Myxococcales bacterium]|nr:hypothetical protein [Myxococcales bacterium]